MSDALIIFVAILVLIAHFETFAGLVLCVVLFFVVLIESVIEVFR